MLPFNWMQEHKREIKMMLVICLILTGCLLVSDYNRGKYFIKENRNVVAINRRNMDQTLTLPLEVEAKKNGVSHQYEVVISLKSTSTETGADDSVLTSEVTEEDAMKAAVTALIDEMEETTDLEIALPTRMEDGTRLQWKKAKDFRFLFTFLLFPIGLLCIYEMERQQKKAKRRQYEEEIRRAMPSFVDQVLLLLNCGMIFHDVFYRISAGYEARPVQDAFSKLLARIRKESDASGSMVITVMKRIAQDVGVREYVRMVNIIMDHQHRGVNLEEKLQGESRLLWEGRKAEALQRGKEMETKMTFPLAVLLLALIIIAGMPALMNM